MKYVIFLAGFLVIGLVFNWLMNGPWKPFGPGALIPFSGSILLWCLICSKWVLV